MNTAGAINFQNWELYFAVYKLCLAVYKLCFAMYKLYLTCTVYKGMANGQKQTGQRNGPAIREYGQSHQTLEMRSIQNEGEVLEEQQQHQNNLV